jgi:hypothetical protein
MFISLCSATVGLSLPSHDTLAVLTTQSTFFKRSFVYSDTRCCVQERLNNGVFCSRIFLLCASLKYDHILTIAADTGIWHTVSQPKQIKSVCDCRPKLLNSTWGYTVISTEGIPVNRQLFLFFFFVMSYDG